MIKAILFDFDDTLVKTMESKWDALRETGRRHFHVAVTNNDLQAHWGKPFDEMLTGVLQHADSIENLRSKYLETTQEFPMKAHDNAVSVLHELVKRFAVGIVTASTRSMVLQDLTLLGFPIEKLFYIQTAEDTTRHKPDPAVFDPILQKLQERGIAKDEVLYVGDSLRDYEAAKAAGIAFYGISHGTTSAMEFRDKDITVIHSFNDLLSLLHV